MIELEKCLCGSKWVLANYFRDVSDKLFYYFCSNDNCSNMYDVDLLLDDNCKKRLFSRLERFDINYQWSSDQKYDHTEIFDTTTNKITFFPFLLPFNLSLTKLETLLLFS